MKNKLIILLAIALQLSLKAQALTTDNCAANKLDGPIPKNSPHDIRFATFNVALNRNQAGELAAELNTVNKPQLSAIAEIIQRVRPEVLLLNEFDYDASGDSIERFQKNYLAKSQNKHTAIHYPYVYLAESNTGMASGFDLDNNGDVGGPGDAYGFGLYPGQYGMVLLSQHPIIENKTRSFQKFLWKDMPKAMIPKKYYTEEELGRFRLSSKSHWDIPLLIHNREVHVLAAHPTPPVFDGEEDRNGRRNHDEIRFWSDYISDKKRSQYIYDDQGKKGGLDAGKAFVIMGDFNADPFDGDSTNNAIQQLLEHPAINSSSPPSSLGAIEDAKREGAANKTHRGNAAYDTGDFNPQNVGNLRIDYVLPSRHNLEIKCGGVFWPQENDTSFNLVGSGHPVVSSDHHLVWQDVAIISAP